MHPIAEAMAYHANNLEFTPEERERIRRFEPHQDRINPQRAMILKMVIRSHNRQWYKDHAAKLRGLKHAAGQR